MPVQPTIFIVHEDHAVRASLSFLLETHGWAVVAKSSISGFLRDYRETPGCLVLSQDMKQTTGLACLAALRRRGIRIPAVIRTVVLTPTLHRRAHSLRATLVDALAIDALLDAINRALDAELPQTDS